MNHRILVIDDETNICDLTQIILEGAGRFEVKTETSSKRALETAKSFLPDLILLDVTMPDKSGHELAREIAAEPSLAKTPIVFMTGLVSREETGGRTIERSGAHYLAKTMTAEELVDAVTLLIDGLSEDGK